MKVDRQLRGVALRRATLDAEELALLRYAEQLKLWLGFGYGSLLEYMEKAMGYTPHTAVERLRVARALAELPMIAGALQRGELRFSVVRELSRVAISETEDVWLEAARGRCAKEVEAMVSGRKAGDLPTDPTEPRLHRRTITIELVPETYDLFRRMHALAAEEHGQRLTDDELLQSLYRRAYGAGGAGSAGGAASAGGAGSVGGDKAGSPAYKIAIKQCPDCKRAWQFTGGRDIEIDPAVAECAACDAVHLGSLDAETPQRATTTVTPRKREQVLARDGYCCTVPGCRRNIGLDIHHIEYQSRGGGHDLSNIISICDLHHRAVHCGKLVIRGTAPDHVTFEFRKPRGYWNLVDDDLADAAATAPPPMSNAETAAARLAKPEEAMPNAEGHAQPLAERHIPQLAEPHTQPLAERHTQQLAERHTQPLAERHIQPLAEPHTQQLAEPHTQPLAERHTQQLAERHTQQLAERHIQQLAEPHTQQLAEPHTQPLAERHTQQLAERHTRLNAEGPARPETEEQARLDRAVRPEVARPEVAARREAGAGPRGGEVAEPGEAVGPGEVGGLAR